MKVRFGQNKTIYQKQKDLVGSVYGVKNAMERKQMLAIKFVFTENIQPLKSLKNRVSRILIMFSVCDIFHFLCKFYQTVTNVSEQKKCTSV